MKLVKRSQVFRDCVDSRFNYEPLLSSHPKKLLKKTFLGKEIGAPLFFSSITGGSYKSSIINKRVAISAKKFNIPMGLGSIRPYLEGVGHSSFKIRKYSGYDIQLFGNIGIAQVEELIKNNKQKKLVEAIIDLELDGLIIHINPLQEWVQEGGDCISSPPLETLNTILPYLKCKIIIKEVGCGFGPESLKELINLPIDVIDIAAFGGTNFTKLELFRGSFEKRKLLSPLINIGHTPDEMIKTIDDLLNNQTFSNKEFIVSGGIKNFLDGYYYNSLLKNNSVYGYAGKVLSYANKSQKTLDIFLENEINSYSFAESFLKIKEKTVV